MPNQNNQLDPKQDQQNKNGDPSLGLGMTGNGSQNTSQNNQPIFNNFNPKEVKDPSSPVGEVGTTPPSVISNEVPARSAFSTADAGGRNPIKNNDNKNLNNSQVPTSQNNAPQPMSNLPNQVNQINKQPKQPFLHNPKLIKVFIVLAIFIIFLGALILFFRLPVKVSVNPKAQLIFDGQNKGEAQNFNFWARPGEHSLRLEKIGYRPQNINFKQSWFKTTALQYTLKKAPQLKAVDKANDGILINENNKTSFLYFKQDSTAFFKYDLQNKTKAQITPSIFKNLFKLKWNESGNGAIVWLRYEKAVFAETLFENNSIADGQIATFYYDFHHYDITKQSATLWGVDIYSVAWGESTDHFFYVGGSDNNGYLAKANNDAQEKTRLLTNMSFAKSEIAIDSQEIYAYILGNKNVYQINLTDPSRSLIALTTNGNIKHLFLIDDNNLLLGVNQANPENLSTEKYSLFNIKNREFDSEEFYANFDWINFLGGNDFVILQDKNNLASSQKYWQLQKISLPDKETNFSFEYLTNRIPDKIYFSENNKQLFVIINNGLYYIPINL